MEITVQFLPLAGLGLLGAFFTAAFLAATKRWHGKLSLDGSTGVQKFHTTPTPRIGGLALLVGLLMVHANVPSTALGNSVYQTLTLLLAAGLPAFGIGLMEDFTKRVSVKIRLLATAASGLLAALFLGAAIRQVDVPGLDFLLTFAPFALVFTSFAVAGVSNSINIIDGFNGLAGGVVVLILGTLSLIAYEVADPTVMVLCLLGAGVVLGFLLVNFPRGFIFLGDAGAYSLGYYVAMMAVLLVARNPGEVSPWAMLLACGYPVIETLFSIYRRVSRRRRHNPGAPDASHLHSLVYRRLVSRKIMPGAKAWKRNAATSPFMWAYAAVPMLGALTWPDSLLMVIAWLLLSFSVYQRFYKRMVRGSVFFRSRQAHQSALSERP
ncbi:MAG TPA: glycosyltransferase [Limnobacter sp.]|uniref:MraY family glycosyltransferase n=1 Tax=Limnobacter sp. TaxID=2003368 RepID=UPI002ED8C3CD